MFPSQDTLTTIENLLESMYSRSVSRSLHSHGGWAGTSKLKMLSGLKIIWRFWHSVSKKKLHIGNHVRRDLFIHPKRQSETEDGWSFNGSVHLSNIEITSPRVAPGGALFIEQRWTIENKRSEDVLAIFALVQDGQVVTSGAFQPGYRWYDMSEWDTDEVVVGKFPMPIAKDLDVGVYELWLTVLDQASGDVLVKDDSIQSGGMSWLEFKHGDSD